MRPELLAVEAYCDRAPRTAARVEEHGSLRLFVAEGVPWAYYARPSGTGAPGALDVEAVRERQWALGVPEAFEWIADLAPTLTGAARQTGLDVLQVPLMALRGPAPEPAAGVRRLDAGDAALAASRAVADLAFGPDRAAGLAERDAAAARWSEPRLAPVRERMDAGLTVTYVAEGEDGVLAVGSHQPLGDVAEVVGVGTLPCARRRGLAAAVTAALVADARRGGAEVVFLSAGGPEVARLYGRLGFRRVGTSALAAPPAG